MPTARYDRTSRKRAEISIEAIQLCLLNASRLLEDSSKVSTPSAAALAELSIEEASKAWMLYFVWSMASQRVHRTAIPKFTANEKSDIGAFLERKRPYIASLRDQLDLAFEEHPPKLEFLRFLSDYIRFTAPMFETKRELVAQLSELTFGRVFNTRKILAETGLQPKSNIFEYFRRRGLTDLGNVKNRGFYVSIARSNEFINPAVNLPVVPLLQGLASYLIALLKFALLSMTK